MVELIQNTAAGQSHPWLWTLLEGELPCRGTQLQAVTKLNRLVINILSLLERSKMGRKYTFIWSCRNGETRPPSSRFTVIRYWREENVKKTHVLEGGERDQLKTKAKVTKQDDNCVEPNLRKKLPLLWSGRSGCSSSPEKCFQPNPTHVPPFPTWKMANIINMATKKLPK